MSLGFLGNSAPNAADVNLIAQLTALFVLFIGAYFARSAKFRAHGLFMQSAIAIQFGAIALWMIPSLLINIGAFGTLGFGPLITVWHIFAGFLALTLAMNAIFHKELFSSQLRTTMRSTFLIWTSAILLGTGFYTYYYILG